MTAGRDLTFWLGLPALRNNALWRIARRLQAPVLISANALSRWRTDSIGLRLWSGFETRWLHLVAQHSVALDSAGFVAASRYNGFPGYRRIPRLGGQRAMAMVGLDELVRRA